MRIELIAAGTRMPRWVREGYEHYAGRLPGECRLTLREIPLGKRRKGGDPAQARREEGERMLSALRPPMQVVALDEGGQAWTTRQLAEQLQGWLMGGTDIGLLVGGPDGLDPRCLERAGTRWSLSALTLPHGLVRVLVAEQLYRAWSLLEGHPYHRA